MMTVQIDDDLHAQVKKMVDKMSIDYPSITFYINQAVKEKLRIDLISLKEKEIEQKPFIGPIPEELRKKNESFYARQ